MVTRPQEEFLFRIILVQLGRLDEEGDAGLGEQYLSSERNWRLLTCDHLSAVFSAAALWTSLLSFRALHGILPVVIAPFMLSVQF